MALADFCTSARLNALKINLLYSKKADGKAFRSAEVQNPLENFHMVSTLLSIVFQSVWTVVSYFKSTLFIGVNGIVEFFSIFHQIQHKLNQWTLENCKKNKLHELQKTTNFVELGTPKGKNSPTQFTQNLHWKLGQQTPSVGTRLAYLETTAYLNHIFLGINLFCFSR